jgi:hypothetical protein
MALCIKTLNTETQFSIIKLSIKTLSITISKHKNSQHKGSVHTWHRVSA